MSIKKQTIEDKSIKTDQADNKVVEGERFHFPTLGVTVFAANRKEAEEKAMELINKKD